MLVQLMNAAPDAMISIDGNGLIVMANLHAERLFGFDHGALIGTPIAPLLPFDPASSPEGSTGVQVIGRQRDGQEFPAEFSNSTLTLGSKSIVTIIVRDISARMRVKSEAERVRLSVEAVRVTAEGEKAEAEDVRLEAEVQRVIAEGEKAEAEHVRLEAEVQRVKAEGEKSVAEDVRLEAAAQLVIAEGEKAEAEHVRLEAEAQLVIAEGEKAEAEHVRLEAEAQLVIAEGEKAEAEDVRLEAEVQRVIALSEKSVAEDVRLEAEVQRIKAEGEKAEAERVRLEAEVQRIIAEGEKAEAERVRLEAEVQRVKAEGEKAEAERVRLEADIELERLEAVIERDRLEGQLHQSQRMESLGQLAGGVAHDFNNLLAVILNYAAFVTEELTVAVSSSDGAHWEGPLKDLQQVQIAAERASVLTHQLLAFARREVIQAQALSINEAITSIEEILRRTIGEQIELTTALEPDLASVIADPGHIEQIILNLAINARDAMPLGGALSIETSSRNITVDEWELFGAPAGAYNMIRISDNGGGMTDEIRDRAFEPFFTTKPRGEGSGLGLATVYGIVLQSGGFIRIYTDEGVGTTVSVLLPSIDIESENGYRSEGHAGSPVGTETILVVDDEEGLREVTRRILTRSGYTVLVATGGAEALEIAASGVEIDLLLTDVIMPKMQGPTVAKEVKKLQPEIRILFMSGHAQPVLEAEEVLGTTFQMVEKPFDQKLLLEHVRRALDADVAITT
jgi:PAS domain S-box-containing protein